MQPSIINYRKLRARKSYFGLTNEALAGATNTSIPTVSALLNGKESVTLAVMQRVAAALRYRVRVDFEPFDADRSAFAEAISEQGISFLAHWDPPRNAWIVQQESAIGRVEVGLFYGLENERLAKLITDTLNGRA